MANGNKLNNISSGIATMYSAVLSFGIQETNLIWSRYAGFIVINGFLVNAVIQKLGTENEHKIFLIVGIIGLLINLLWHVINFSGWQNQNKWYFYASKVLENNSDDENNQLKLPTDSFRDIKPPFGPVYMIAQALPLLVGLGSSFSIYYGLKDYNPPFLPIFISIIALAVCIVIALVLENSILNKVKDEVK